MKKNYINKRKLNIFNIKFSLIFSIFAIVIFFFNLERLTNYSYHLIQKYSDIYDYNFSKIEVSKLEYFNRKEIEKYFDQFKGKSIFLIPINKLSNNIQEIKWIKNVNIKSDYKNTLNVVLLEEIPLGIYDNNNQKVLFSNNLVILDIISNNKDYSKLITFYGQNSINNSLKINSHIEKSFLKGNVDSVEFIKNRRWNLKLQNNILLKLPENNINEAINNYKKLYESFSNQDLKDIQSIDLRIQNQAIIKYKNLLDD